MLELSINKTGTSTIQLKLIFSLCMIILLSDCETMKDAEKPQATKR